MQASSPESLSAADEKRVRAITDSMQDTPGALLPILHAVQKDLGFVPQGSVGIIAEALNLSRAEVHGVVTFYHYFRTTPPGERTLFVCRAEACKSMGADELEKHVKEKLGVDYHETTADGKVSLEPVYCLGNCACSPAVMVDDKVYGRVSADRMNEILETL